MFKYVNCHDASTLCNVEATVCYAQVRQLSRCDGVLRNRTANCRQDRAEPLAAWVAGWGRRDKMLSVV